MPLAGILLPTRLVPLVTTATGIPGAAVWGVYAISLLDAESYYRVSPLVGTDYRTELD